VRYDRALGAELRAKSQSAKGTSPGGQLLELLAGYLFWTSGEYEVRWRLRGIDAETDLLVRALAPSASPHGDLGGYLLVECKNTTTPMSASALKKFATDVRLSGCRCGVVVSESGISGNEKERRDASYTLRKLYHADGTILILLDPHLLDAIVDERLTLVDALRQRYEEIRFDVRM
jgi:hypothetical protein